MSHYDKQREAYEDKIALQQNKHNLKPCPVPWCNGYGVVNHWHEFDNFFVHVKCSNDECKCKTDDFDFEDEILAVDRWNERPLEDQLETAKGVTEDAIENYNKQLHEKQLLGRSL